MGSKTLGQGDREIRGEQRSGELALSMFLGVLISSCHITSERQREQKRRSAIGVLFGPQLAAMSFDDRAADRQAQTEAV